MGKKYSRILLVVLACVALVIAGYWGRGVYLKNREIREAQRIKKSMASWHRDLKAEGCMETLCFYAFEYAKDHDGYLPLADNWETALQPYALKDGFNLSIWVTSPFLPGPRRMTMNKALSGCKIGLSSKEISDGGYSGIILFYESISTKPNATGYLEPLPPAPNDEQTAIGFLDGSAKTFLDSSLGYEFPFTKPMSLLSGYRATSRALEKTLIKSSTSSTR